MSPRLVASIPLAFLLVACASERPAAGTPPATATPVSLRAATATALDAEVGLELTDAPAVIVLDGRGAPVAGVAVHFTPTAGTLSDSLVRTDAAGLATTRWTLGPTAGPQQVTARVGELAPVVFNALARPGRVARLLVARGNEQTGVAGARLAIDPAVQAVDRLGNGIGRIRVTFTPDPNAGTTTPTEVATDAAGMAATGWTLGTALGSQRLAATVAGADRVGTIITATATTGSPATHTVVAGNNQTAAAYGAVAVRPATRITDGNGNPIAGLPVTFVVASGGGTISGAATTTDANGTATVGSWTLGGLVGPQLLVARSPGLPEASINATATVPAGGTITVTAGANQTAPVGTLVPIAPSVVVRDGQSRPLGGVEVTFTTTGGGTVTPATVITSTTGVATVTSWRLGPTAGPNTLVAARPGLASASLTATATASGVPTLERTVVLSGLQNPWDLAFTPENALLLTERVGRLRVRLPDGTTRLLYQPPDVRAQDQGGLLGVTVDPQFASNRFIYIMLSANVAGGRVENRVRRLRVNGDYTAVDSPLDIVDSIPWGNGGAHNGGRLRFGADGFLYVGSGDNRSGPTPQRLTGLGGKVLRVTRDGAPAPGNVSFGAQAHPTLFAVGFRNVQGLALRPSNGQLFSCEHGPGHSDEVTRLVNGGNGGWDPMTAPDTTYRGYDGGRSMTDLAKFPAALRPTWTTGTSSFGMSGCGFVTGPQWRDWDGALVVALLSGRRAEVLRLSADGSTATSTPILGTFGDRLRVVQQGPDGDLYVLTDGRAGGDQLWRLTPR